MPPPQKKKNLWGFARVVGSSQIRRVLSWKKLLGVGSCSLGQSFGWGMGTAGVWGGVRAQLGLQKGGGHKAVGQGLYLEL